MAGFRRLLQSVDGDLPRFYSEVRQLAAQPKELRQQELCGEGQVASRQ